MAVYGACCVESQADLVSVIALDRTWTDVVDLVTQALHAKEARAACLGKAGMLEVVVCQSMPF
jgi:hypothetical protein